MLGILGKFRNRSSLLVIRNFKLMEDELKEYVSWLEEEIEKENERAKNGETKTGIRKWSLIIIKNLN